jgi:hypothetical protein
MAKRSEVAAPGSIEDRTRDMLENTSPSEMAGLYFGEIEYILKVPRTMDPHVAELLNERHRKFVEDEFRHFSLALKDAEHLSSECTPSSRRSREGARGSIEQP